MTKTIGEIAKLAGVAKSTVSRYLNGGSVSAKTKLKIETVITETGYVPNTFARSLKAKKTNIIGTIVPRLNSFATAQTLIGIDEELKDSEYQLLISNTSQDLNREIDSIYSLANQKVAGLILLATKVTERHLDALNKVNIPVILVGQQSEECYSLIHDDEHAGFEIGKYVIGQGHSNIVYLGVSEEDIAVGVKRKKGFKRATYDAKCAVHFAETDFDLKEAMKKFDYLYETYKPTIIVCATDNIALGILKAAQLKGLKVPDDLSITGFGGYDITEITHPSITTVQYYYKEAGLTAAKNIIKLINNEEIHKLTMSKTELVIRESVDKIR
ncbi:LacI family DNA-binding transcriptional regulator [Metabacillus malikii]|uniref:LacI family sucrose operon transcriptional repressor n=1 Tax=Metabacillus malikii TaxID=1504265 RepID=A0ABT9ZDM2_9BACI|nr:LacI family DNA-binding transcriptional regulator [Metabacillus malikii]MDQ0230365.1 LacI family sucrose operon transcriptional repressor [Metabacillus malikii]